MASEYHRGDMEISEQVATFHAFNLLTKWGSLALSVALLFLTLLFCTKTGFLGSFASAFVLTVVGIVMLREKKKPAH